MVFVKFFIMLSVGLLGLCMVLKTLMEWGSAPLNPEPIDPLEGGEGLGTLELPPPSPTGERGMGGVFSIF